MNIVDPILKQAQQHGSLLALSDNSVSLNYENLAQETVRLANYLRSLGIDRGDRLMVVGENSVALALMILAGSYAGAVIVLENARRAPLEIDAVMNHCQPARTIYVFAQSPDSEAHAGRTLVEIVSDPAIGPFGVTAPYPAGLPDEAVREPGIAALIYTTGTTGTPKGVMLTHDNLCFIASMMAELRGISCDDIVYCILPITHVMGLASVFLGSLHAGAHVHLRARFSATTCLAEINSLGVTALQGATAMFAKLAETGDREGWRPAGKMRFIGAGGAPIDPTVKLNTERLFGITLHNGYGLTEAASTCWTRIGEDNTDDTVGRPLPGVQLKVCDDRNSEVSDHAIGELWVRGPHVMRGYFRSPVQTSEVLTSDGWFNTQDLARIAQDGRVYVVGRKKDVIIRSGFKVNPLEVETILNRHPSIAQSAVIGRTVSGNEEVVAFVELASPCIALPDNFAEYLRDTLSPYKHPSEIVVLASLPLAPNGKVLKHRLLHTAKGCAP